MSVNRLTSAPELKTLPPIAAAFEQHVKRAHYQTMLCAKALLLVRRLRILESYTITTSFRSNEKPMVIFNLLIMFLVQWMYALCCLLTIFLIYFYIGRTNPGVTPGIAEFKFFPWVKKGIFTILGKSSPEYDQIVVTPNHPGVEVMAAQITEDNEDFSGRERYHQSSLVKPGTGYHDYQVDD
ncbi:Solute carrier family 12 member 8 [Nymphon striatum]|nr:Solute carrier family 12 member 8 [Nymphon striatum]